MPHTPGHDGVRLFLPAFGVLALLGGLGPGCCWIDPGRWGTAAIVAALAEGIASVAVMMPVPLSYFSPVVGGLPGATALGMEPTYYWDALTPEARRWLAEHTPAGPDDPVRDQSRPRGYTCGGPANCRGDSIAIDPRSAAMVRRAEPARAFFEDNRALAAQGRAALCRREAGRPPASGSSPTAEGERFFASAAGSARSGRNPVAGIRIEGEDRSRAQRLERRD